MKTMKTGSAWQLVRQSLLKEVYVNLFVLLVNMVTLKQVPVRNVTVTVIPVMDLIILIV